MKLLVTKKICLIKFKIQFKPLFKIWKFRLKNKLFFEKEQEL